MKAAQILLTPAFTDFYKSATDFCGFMERELKHTSNEFLQTSRIHLLNLYDTALKLPVVDLETTVEYEYAFNNLEFEQVLSCIVERLGTSRYYWHIFNPSREEDTKPVCGDLSDDLGDMYKDIHRSISLFNKPDGQESALWQFKFDFDNHWGDHCMNALNAIHFYLQK